MISMMENWNIKATLWEFISTKKAQEDSLASAV